MRVDGTDIYISIRKDSHVERDNGGTKLVDGLGGLAQVPGLNAGGRKRRDIGIVERGAPPVPLLVPERCPVAKEAADETSL